jgi:hypothetical protein
MKTPFHFVGIWFFSYFLGAEVLLEGGRRTEEARAPALDKGADR